MLKPIAYSLAAALLAAMLGGSPANAQQAAQTSGIKRIPLQSHDIPGTNYQAVQGIAEIGPNVKFPAHTHPGVEISYVLQGSLVLNIKGEKTQTIHAGHPSYVPVETAHWGHAGPRGAKILATWIVEKGKPLASPAKE